MDFVYSRSMEVILDIISLITIFISTYLITNLILVLYGEKVNFTRKSLYSLVLTLYYTAFIYGVYAIGGFARLTLVAIVFLTIPNPTTILFSYIMGIKILKLSPFKSIGVVRMTGFYTMAINSFNILLRATFFNPGIPFNYLTDSAGLLVCLVLHIITYAIALTWFKRKNTLQVSDNLPVKNHMRELLISFVILVVCYGIAASIISLPSYNRLTNILALAGLVFCLYADYMLSCTRSLLSECDNRNVYIRSLSASITEFKEKKDDYNALLKSYGDIIEYGNIENIRNYHESIMGKTIITGEKLRMTRRIKENPALVSLILQKIDYAEKMNIAFHIPVLSDLNEMYIENMDLCRVIGNLLDNAIEAAAVSPKKIVSFSIENRNVNGKLIVISNSTDDDIDIQKILVRGVSFKHGHTGLGLSQVRKSLKKYGGSSIHFTYYDREFSVYIKLYAPDDAS